MPKTLDQFLAEYQRERDAEEKRQERLQLERNNKLMREWDRQLQEVLGTDLCDALNLKWYMHSNDTTCCAEFDAYEAIWIIQPVNAIDNTYRFYPYDNRNTTELAGQNLAHIIIVALYQARALLFNYVSRICACENRLPVGECHNCDRKGTP